MTKFRILVATLLLALMGTALAQSTNDSAAIVINRYLSNLGHDSLNWQTVDIKSVITFSDGNDTIMMERRFAFPEYPAKFFSTTRTSASGQYSLTDTAAERPPIPPPMTNTSQLVFS